MKKQFVQIRYRFNNKKSSRIRRFTRTRYKFKELQITRLVVHRTPKHIYAQIISPNDSRVLAAASTVEKNISCRLDYPGNKKSSVIIGEIIAKRAIEKGIKNVSFDRSGFKYHGRVKELANAARKAGLKF